MPNELMGFCPKCDDWQEFHATDPEWRCPIHHIKFSSRHGEQITSKRTWSPTKKRRKR